MRTPGLIAVATAAVLLAAPAAAQAPASFLVGGTLGPRDDGYASPHDAFVTLGGDEGAQVPVTATTAVACGGHTRQVRLDATGTRDATGALLVSAPFTSDGGRLRATVTLFARTLGDEASGTLEAAGTLRVPGRARAVRCRGTSLGWRAHRLGATPAATGAVPGAALMVGATTGGDLHAPVSPILLRTSADGRTLAHAKWRVRVPCRTGGDDDLTFGFRPYPLRAGGGFVADKHAIDREGDVTYETSVRFGGHLGADGATGYLRVVEHATRAGRAFDACDTGRLRWTALLTPPAAPAAP